MLVMTAITPVGVLPNGACSAGRGVRLAMTADRLVNHQAGPRPGHGGGPGQVGNPPFGWVARRRAAWPSPVLGEFVDRGPGPFVDGPADQYSTRRPRRPCVWAVSVPGQVVDHCVGAPAPSMVTNTSRRLGVARRRTQDFHVVGGGEQPALPAGASRPGGADIAHQAVSRPDAALAVRHARFHRR